MPYLLQPNRKLLFLSALLFLFTNGLRAQTQADRAAIAVAALRTHPHSRILVDSAQTLDLLDCFPSLFTRLGINATDSARIVSKTRKKTGFSWKQIRLRGIEVISYAAAKPFPYRNRVALSEPVFRNKTGAFILLDTNGGGQVFYLEKKGRWRIAGTYCYHYY
ncbi:hypothetical protein [Flaviaesturariibacter amylovorans]|uniref:hypothetical protein n=1 Tax=Flaviaesturariibacter amylovorans TaxID=1084520 RepID=UPI0031EF9991